jgi:hypothetical protein
LLVKTLESFQKNMFSRLPVRCLFLNIDPLWGSRDDDTAVESVAREFCRDVVVRRPDRPGFGDAVKWLWGQPETEWFLHLEDDWLLRDAVSPQRLAAEMRDARLFQIRFSFWPRLKRLVRPAQFTTSPGFVRTEHSRVVASLMDAALDPEKQMITNANPPLRRFLASVRTRYYGSLTMPPMVADIGREWRKGRGIEKRIVDGVSVWSV